MPLLLKKGENMPELRKDYLMDRYVIIASERSKRPVLFKKTKVSNKKNNYDKQCPFCKGNEAMLPGINKEYNVKKGKSSDIIRIVPNKYEAAMQKGNPELRNDNLFYTYSSSYGIHEVIIETLNHSIEFEELPLSQIKKIIEVYIESTKELIGKPNIKYISLFKNQGKEAGASINHTHSQIIGYNIVPELVKEKNKKAKEFFEKNNKCAYCEIIEREKDSDRRVFENDSFIAFCPYASRFQFEVLLMPKRHFASLIDMDKKEIKDLAESLKKILTTLEKIGPTPFNIMFFNTHKVGDNENYFHFHIEIAPRISNFAGFEIETETIINTTTPEDAASFYRENL
jgi:UDPglucose--hexose-1-phosphate uridylyltransferase